MSAMSELKLHQATLERENFELRSSHLNNNNAISNDRRLPPVPANRIRTNSTSGSMVNTPHIALRSGVDKNYFQFRHRHPLIAAQSRCSTIAYHGPAVPSHQRQSIRPTTRSIIYRSAAAIITPIKNGMRLHLVMKFCLRCCTLTIDTIVKANIRTSGG